MRANESLPLTAQADAAFLLKLVRAGADAVRNGAVKDTKHRSGTSWNQQKKAAPTHSRADAARGREGKRAIECWPSLAQAAHTPAPTARVPARRPRQRPVDDGASQVRRDSWGPLP